MSHTLLHRAPAHQPPPPSASKSRSRSSCRHRDDEDDGVPNLQLNTAHYRGDVREARAHPLPPPPPRSATIYTAVARSPTELRHGLAFRQPPFHAERSRLEADDDPLQDSLSYTEATATPDDGPRLMGRPGVTGPGGWPEQESPTVTTATSVIFEGDDSDRDDCSDGAQNTNNASRASGATAGALASPSFQLPSGAGSRHDDASSADASPLLYEAYATSPQAESSSTSVAPQPRADASTAATPHAALTHVAACRPLQLQAEAAQEHTSRKLVFSASAMVPSPSKPESALRRAARRVRGGEAEEHAVAVTGVTAQLVSVFSSGDGESVSSPLLHPARLAEALPPSGLSDRVRGEPAQGWTARMAPLVPPPAERELPASPLDSEHSPQERASATRLLRPSEHSRHHSETRESCETVLASAGQQPESACLPPSPHADLDRANAKMESVMSEMAVRLRSHDRSTHHPRDDGLDVASSGDVRSKEGSPVAPFSALETAALHRSTVTNTNGDGVEGGDGRRPRSQSVSTPDEPHLGHRGFHPHEEADLVCSVRDESIDDDDGDCFLPPPPPRRSSRPSYRLATGDGDEEGDEHAFCERYTFFAAQLPPPVNRREQIQQLARILREGEALYASSQEREEGNKEEKQKQQQQQQEEKGEEEEEAVLDAATYTKEPACVPEMTNAATMLASLTNNDVAAESPLRSPRRGVLLTSPMAERDGSLSVSDARRHSVAGAVLTQSESLAEMLSASASLSTSTARRQRPPPRMLCPPTPSPSRPRVDDTATAAAAVAGEKEEEATQWQLHWDAFDGDVHEVTPRAELERESDKSMQEEGVQDPAAQSRRRASAERGAWDKNTPLPCDFFTVHSPVLVLPLSARAAATVAGLTPPFFISRPLYEVSAATSHTGPPLSEEAAEEENDERGGDSTASVLTACSDADAGEDENNRGDAHPRSVLYGPTDGSVCAADESAPLPLSPTNQGVEPPASSCGAARPHMEAHHPASKGIVPAAFCRTDQVSRRRDEAAAAAPSSARHDSRSTGAHEAPYGTSVVRRSLAQLTSLDREADEKGGHSSRRQSSAAAQHHSASVHGSAAAGELWGTLTSGAGAESEERSAEAATQRRGHPSVESPSTHGGRHTTAHSSASRGSSPLPVRPPLPPRSVEPMAAVLTSFGSDGEEGDDDDAHLVYVMPSVLSRPGQGVNARDADRRDAQLAWQSATDDALFSQEDKDGESDGSDDDNAADTHTPAEELLQRAEGKAAVLRLQLTEARERATAAEAALGEREAECAELHRLVDQLKAQLAAQSAPASLHAPAARLEEAAIGPTTASTSVPASGAPAAEEVWRSRHDAVAQELAHVKGSMAEQLAVLDRLGLCPPFEEAHVAAAERRLRHVRVANNAARQVCEAAMEREKGDGMAVVGQGASERPSVLAVLTQRKHQQQQQQLSKVPKGVRKSTDAAAHRAGSAQSAGDAKENYFS